MPQHSLLRVVPQRVLNTIVAAVLLLTIPVLSHGVEAPPPRALVAISGSATATQLTSQLPITMTFNDRMGAAVFAQLPAALTVAGSTPISGYRAGDVAYIASERSIVIFLSDGSAVPDHGLVLIGHLTSPLGSLASCVRDCAVQLAAAEGSRPLWRHGEP